MVVVKENWQTCISNIFEIINSHEVGRKLAGARAQVSDSEGESKKPHLTIREKYEQGHYGTNLLALYTDFKSATMDWLSMVTVGSSEYDNVFNFFKYITEILLREGFVAQSKNETSYDTNKPAQEFQASLTTEFSNIAQDYTAFHAEHLVISGQTGPLFSSLTGKASFDPRPTKEPSSFSTSKSLPYIPTNLDKYAPVLDTLSLMISRIPHPALPPTEILNTYRSPLDIHYSPAKWFKYDGYMSFAPTCDSTHSVLTSDLASFVWLEKALAREAATNISESDQMCVDSNDSNTANLNASSETTSHKSQTDLIESFDQTSNGSLTHSGHALDLSDSSSQETEEDSIDIIKILEWGPENFVDDDELLAAEKGSESELVSRLLLELQQFQRKRLTQNTGKEKVISKEERHLALKIQNVLLRLLPHVRLSELDLTPSPYLPTLQTSYSGTLPSTDPKLVNPVSRQANQAMRLTSRKNKR